MIRLLVWLAVTLAHPDHDLIQQALGGRRGARRMLVRRLTPVIAAHIHRALRRGGAIPGTEVSDLLQEVWLTLCKDDGRQLRAWDPARASLEHFVGLIARRTAFNRRRAQRSRPDTRADDLDPQTPESTAPAESTTVARNLAIRLIEHIRATLSPRGALVFTLLYEDGLSADQAATALNVQRAVIHNWNSRIRAASKAFLEAQQVA